MFNHLGKNSSLFKFKKTHLSPWMTDRKGKSIHNCDWSSEIYQETSYVLYSCCLWNPWIFKRNGQKLTGQYDEMTHKFMQCHLVICICYNFIQCSWVGSNITPVATGCGMLPKTWSRKLTTPFQQFSRILYMVRISIPYDRGFRR